MNEKERLQQVLEYVEDLLNGLCGRPQMFADEADSELLAVRALEIRALALGSTVFNWKRWCQRNYPEAPGPVRSAYGTFMMRSPGPQRVREFTREIARMIRAERGRQDREVS